MSFLSAKELHRKPGQDNIYGSASHSIVPSHVMQSSARGYTRCVGEPPAGPGAE